LTRKRVLITGAARGIGRAVTVATAEAGAFVGINYLTSAVAAAELHERFSDRSVLLRADIREPAAVTAMVEEFVGRAGGVDVLVNNAGIIDAKLLVRNTPEGIRNVVVTNLLGSIFATQSVMRHMVRQRNGLIIFHSSIAVDQPRPGLAAYSAAKAGVEAFARSVALEYRKRGVRTVCLRLGPFRTDMHAAHTDAEKQQIESRILAGRVPDPDTVARFIGSLIATEDTLLDGSVVSLDSGYSLGLD
jgi:3-oxoacyl-[acyl-carrier protein] reductase